MNALATDPANRSRMFKILSPIEKKGGGTHWMRLGTGYANKDQSVNIFLDALPLNHKLQLREMDEEDFRPRGGRRDEGPPVQSAASELPF